MARVEDRHIFDLEERAAGRRLRHKGRIKGPFAACRISQVGSNGSREVGARAKGRAASCADHALQQKLLVGLCGDEIADIAPCPENGNGVAVISDFAEFMGYKNDGCALCCQGLEQSEEGIGFLWGERGSRFVE